MAEFEQTFENGTWVTGEDTNGTSFKRGLVVDFDQGDGEHMVVVDPSGLADIAKESMQRWCRPDDIETADAPEWAGGGPEHVFVLDWMDDNVPNVQAFADPAAVTDWLDERAPENLQLKLMESVADPGERVELSCSDGEVGVRFCAVAGNEVA